MAVDRRELIVEAASKSFALFGYKATTMEQVAKIANVGKGTIYTFFANKEELFQEIMNLLIQELKVIADAAVDPKRRFFDNMSLVLERLMDFQEEHELAMKLSQEVREISTQMAHEGIQQIENAIVSYIRRQVEQAMEKDEIKPCNPELTAFVMLKLFVALTADWKKSHEPLDKSQVAQLLRLYLEDGLAS
ncbi:TetR/AcrR family transcriptional regulator [Paenibacillus spongiae]|uniref:TetR/AcrR family transcriptional regulator n=1 Tax=Paenibacillus spongiae TaxID=2909671 RepID=A0ABY5SBG1_9BACL|nr:TetR/AcrR family transcriptional regulator [Paenibacillus spongiae]UVI29638.1 TetR/AcrR family transcriptional regulator [Paenibacillus spongiae]